MTRLLRQPVVTLQLYISNASKVADLCGNCKTNCSELNFFILGMEPVVPHNAPPHFALSHIYPTTRLRCHTLALPHYDGRVPEPTGIEDESQRAMPCTTGELIAVAIARPC